MSNQADEIIDLVTRVVLAARDFTPRQTIELGFIHGLCLDAARKNSPHLTEFLASVKGLVAITAILTQLPHIVTSNDPKGSIWTFVRTNH